MTKSKKRREKKPTQQTVTKPIISLSTKQQDILYLALIVILLVVLLKPFVLDGLSPRGVDSIGSLGAKHQVNEFTKETGNPALWNPYLFSGMPTYHRHFPVTFSIDTILNYLAKLFSTVFIYYLFAAIGCYIMFRYLKMPPLISFIATLLFILMPHYKSLYLEGHMAKFRALMVLPWVLLSFLYFLDKRSILSVSFFAIAFGTQIRTQHYQIVFYTALLIFAVGLYPFLKDLIQRKYRKFSKSTILLIGAIVLGITMSAQPLFLANEYLPYSKRGKTTINLRDKDKNINKQAASDGVQLEYATQWSTHPVEILTWFIPRFYGGMSGETYTGNDVPQLKNRMIPGYWGHMPFTQSYEYMGAITLLLAIIGLYFNRKNTFIISLISISTFFILLSFGRHFLIFYTIFYDFFPFFNKFRAPVMSVTVTSFIISIFAAYGLKYLSTVPAIKSIKENKSLSYIIGGFIGFGIVLFILAQGFSYTHAGDNYDPRILEMIKNARKDFFTTDLIRYLVLIVLAGTTILGYLYRKIPFMMMVLFLAAFILFDLISIRFRYQDKFSDLDKIEKQYFRKTDSDKFLLADDETFRVFPVGKLLGDNRWAYYHQSIGGYSPIKMYTIEELLENNLYTGSDKGAGINFNVLKILNVKYLIAQQNISHPALVLAYVDKASNQNIYLYQDYLKRGFFIGEYLLIQDEYERLEMLNNPSYDPARTAILEETPLMEFQSPDSSNVILESFTPNQSRYKVFTDQQSLFVISEMFYPPGWKIYVDEMPVDKIYKTDHAIQSIILPKGNHNVDLRFEPDSYFIYKKLSYASLGIIYLIIIISSIMTYKDNILRKINLGNNKSVDT